MVSRSGAEEPIDVSGYSIIEAENGEAVVALVQSHPFVERSGILQVNEPVTV